MTAVELVKKQDRQLRIEAHVQADRKAKRREFDDRYGNTHKHPADTRRRSAAKHHSVWYHTRYVLKLLGF
jgi:hypothetical protein